MSEKLRSGYSFVMRRVVQDVDSGVWSVGDAVDLEGDFVGLRYKSMSGLHSYGECKVVYSEDYAEEGGERVWFGSSAFGGRSLRGSVDVSLSLYFFADDEGDVSLGLEECGANYHAFMDWLGNDGMVIWEDDLRCRVVLLRLGGAEEPDADNICGIPYIGVTLKFANVLGRSYAVGDYAAIEEWLGLDDGSLSSGVDVPSLDGDGAVAPAVSGYSFVMRRIEQDADSGGWIVGDAVDLESSFAGLRYKSFEGLHHRGEGKNVYTEDRAEVEGEDVWVGSSAYVDGSVLESPSVRESVDMKLTLYFFSTVRGTQAEEARSCGDNFHAFMDYLGNDGFVYYEDDLRRRCCLMYLSGSVEPETDSVNGKVYLCVEFTFTNVLGRTYSVSDVSAVNAYLASGGGEVESVIGSLLDAVD